MFDILPTAPNVTELLWFGSNDYRPLKNGVSDPRRSECLARGRVHFLWTRGLIVGDGCVGQRLSDCWNE